MNCKLCQYKKVTLFTKTEKFSYYLCTNCKTLFLNPFPRNKVLSDYYLKNFNYQAGSTNKERTEDRAKIILNKLQKFNPIGKTLLDIGVGYGYFLKQAENNNLKTTGIEPSKKLCRVLVRYLTKTKIINIDIENFLKINKQKFDFITLIHVIEHLPNPKQTINKVSKRLNKNGILYIETPNFDSYLFRAEKINYTFLTPPEHLWLFSKKSLEKTICKIPTLKIIKLSTYSYPEHLMGIVKNILNTNKFIHQSMAKSSDLRGQLEIGTTSWKYRIFDKLLAPFFTPLLNLNQYGSILELYIRKK